MLDIQDWDGRTISEPGLYRGIPLDKYHNDLNLLNGPSVSKSSIKFIAPMEGTPKRFWQNSPMNPNRIKPKRSKALDFGSATHAILLGDQIFDDHYVVRPETVQGETYHGNKKVWRDWYKEQEEAGIIVITEDDMTQIARMAADAHQHPLALSGGFDGEIEISMFAKDPATGIWLKARPDIMHPETDGVFVDLKSAGSLMEDFLERQLEAAGYHIQAAITKKVCDLLGIPFNSFTLFYTLTADYADSDIRPILQEDIVLGEAAINYGLDKIRDGLNTGKWPGVSIYGRENYPIGMKPFTRARTSDFLKMEGYLK